MLELRRSARAPSPRRGTADPAALSAALVPAPSCPPSLALAACGGSSSADIRLRRRSQRHRRRAAPGLLRQRHPRRRADRRPGGPVRQGARRHQAHHPGLQRRPGRGRGAVRRRDRRRLHRPQPDDQRLRAERRRRDPDHRRRRLRRRAARRPRRHQLRRRPQGHDARQPPAGQHPGRRAAHLARPTQGLKNSVDGRRRRHDRADGQQPTSSTCSRAASSTAPGCPSPTPRGWCSRAAATCWSTRRTCGRTASSSPRT